MNGFLMEVGDSSIVFMRKLIEGDLQAAVLDDPVVLGEDQQCSGAHSVRTVAALNGRGKRIVTNPAFFEGLGVSVWERGDDEQGSVVRLQNGCGS